MIEYYNFLPSVATLRPWAEAVLLDLRLSVASLSWLVELLSNMVWPLTL